MKRPRADSELEDPLGVDRDVFHPGSMKSFFQCGSPTTTTQVMARKKRRGIIEKRRRDRINNSLLELCRLVPMALEKQGSVKLEKAEILQMTVDHLKTMQLTRGKDYLDTPVLALDFWSLGFRECVTEVSRYLSAVEGLDSGDALPSHLLSHLATCASQHDTVALTTASHLPPPFPPQHWAAAVATLRPLPYGLSRCLVHPDCDQRGVIYSSFSSSADSASTLPSSSSTSPLVLPCPPTPVSTSFLSLSASFPITFPLHPLSSGPPSASTSSSFSQTARIRLYRPWGTELGAF